MKSLKSLALIATGSLLIGASSLLACEIPVDVHPTSCPNPINVKSKGLVPAAILGGGMMGGVMMNVKDIDPLDQQHGVQMVYPPYYAPLPEGIDHRIVVQAVKFRYEDVATPYGAPVECDNEYSCTENGPDGILDLTLKFPAQGKTTKDGVYHPGVADLLKGLAPGETRCVEIDAWTRPVEDDNGVVVKPSMRWHGKDVVIVKGAK